jgi:single-strand DNA-binding protein
MSANITIVGRLSADPEIRFAASGKPIAKFTVVSSRNKKVDNEWKEIDTTFWNVTAFNKLAENICESFAKGNRIIVLGKAKIENYETANGEKRNRTEITADYVGASIEYDPVKIIKVDRPQEGRKAFQKAKASIEDPWSAPDEIGF